MGMITTPWKFFSENGARYRISATYGIDYAFGRRHSQHPHFSVTGRIDKESHLGTWHDDGGGSFHEEVAEHFPELRKCIKWHLVSLSEPLHYLANAKYWLEKATGNSDWPDQPGEQNPLDALKKSIIFGVVDGDAEAIARFNDPHVDFREFEKWLRSRKEPLMLEFGKDMSELGVLE